jgi:acetylornithine/N-succinyldiaminopimelate aminotransferase
VNDLLQVGDHGTTFGGGPVTTAVAGRVTDLLLNEGFLEGVRERAEYLDTELETMKSRYPFITTLRGHGLLRGIAVAPPAGYEGDILADILAQARDRGLLILRSGADAVRLAPPLVISREELQTGIEILHAVFEDIENR